MTFQTAIAAQTAETLARDLDHYLGNDWFQLTHQEEFVFGIDAARFPAMVIACDAYHD